MGKFSIRILIFCIGWISFSANAGHLESHILELQDYFEYAQPLVERQAKFSELTDIASTILRPDYNLEAWELHRVLQTIDSILRFETEESLRTKAVDLQLEIGDWGFSNSLSTNFSKQSLAIAALGWLSSRSPDKHLQRLLDQLQTSPNRELRDLIREALISSFIRIYQYDHDSLEWSKHVLTDIIFGLDRLKHSQSHVADRELIDECLVAIRNGILDQFLNKRVPKTQYLAASLISDASINRILESGEDPKNYSPLYLHLVGAPDLKTATSMIQALQKDLCVTELQSRPNQKALPKED